MAAMDGKRTAPGRFQSFVSSPKRRISDPTARGRSMSEYRLYCLGGDGKIEAAEEITASGDAEAIMIAKSMKKPVKCELWERGRMVALIDAYRAWPKKP